MRYYYARLKEKMERRAYEVYTADSFWAIVSSLGAKGAKRYSEILHPVPVDTRDPKEVAMERAEKMGLKVVTP